MTTPSHQRVKVGGVIEVEGALTVRPSEPWRSKLSRYMKAYGPEVVRVLLREGIDLLTGFIRRRRPRPQS